MTAVNTKIYQALSRLAAIDARDQGASADLELLRRELERLANAYDAFGRFPRKWPTTPGYFTVEEQAVRDLARYRVKYERVRAAARKLNEVLRQRRYQQDRKRYVTLLRVIEALTAQLGSAVTTADPFTWVRFETKAEYEEYAMFRRQPRCFCGAPTVLGYVHRKDKSCWQPAEDQTP